MINGQQIGVLDRRLKQDSLLLPASYATGTLDILVENMVRYWSIGPQQTIYLPAEWLKKGKNEIEVFEMLQPGQEVLKGVEQPVLNKLQTG